MRLTQLKVLSNKCDYDIVMEVLRMSQTFSMYNQMVKQ